MNDQDKTREQLLHELTTLRHQAAEREKVEAELRSRTAQYRSVFEDSPIPLGEGDFSGVKRELEALRAAGVTDFEAWFESHPESLARCWRRIKFNRVNRASLRLLKASNESEFFANLASVFGENFPDIFLKGITSLAGGETYFASEVVLKTLNHERLNTIAQVSIALGHEENWEQVLISLLDLTERVQAEEARRESENRFKIAFRTSPDSININRMRDGLYIDVNEGFTALTGFTAEDVIGKTSQEIGIWADMKDRERLVQGLKATGHVQNLEAQFRFKDGTIRNGLMSARIIQFGGELCILSITRDISEYKRLEAESRKAEILEAELKKEKEIIALKERFISTISHEFRTPLSVIKTSSDLLSRYFDKLPDERRQQLIQQIGQHITHMTDLIDDTLDLNRAQAGRTEFSPARLEAESFCRAIFDQAQFADNCHHQFEFVSHAPDKPMMVDGRLLRHILTNLLSNAVKYSPDNTRIRFELDHTAEVVIFRVTDEGIGIPENDIEWLFEPFHRAENVGNIKGTGLGLAIVKQYVDIHGGRIEVQSEEGKGSIFSVFLPRT